MDVFLNTNKDSHEVLKELTTTKDGLSALEAEKRRARYGFNNLETRPVRWWEVLARQFKTPFIYLLLGAGILSFVLAEKIDAAIIFGFIFINGVLGFLEEYHSQRSLELLKRFVVAECKVRRGGKEMVIESRQLVPGDIVIVSSGDIVPADIRYIECNSLVADESVLTGESLPIEKNASAMRVAAQQNHEAKNLGFSGTSIREGRGVGVVLATGKNTIMGEIARLTVETYHKSAFEKGISKFSTFILRMIIGILVLLFFVNLLLRGWHTNILELLLFSIALAVSVVPEALPVVTTIALSKGATQMARHKVVVKRLSAVEDLGSIEILCTDKTGTLTENKLSVHAVESDDPETCTTLAAVASSFLGNHAREANNAFDLALWNKLSAAEQARFKSYSKICEMPFDPDRRRNSVLVKNHEGTKLIVRGAPEAVLPLCRHLTAAAKAKFQQWIKREGESGNRVIAVAEKNGVPEKDCYGVQEENDLAFCGLVSFVDPIKPTAVHALAEAKKLGVTVKILTGDSPEVAGAVAREVGLISSTHEVATGEDLEAAHDAAARLALVKKTAVFARVSPEQKYAVIELLQKNAEVGFLGEGINDAPALKMADVGIVVSDASDIARDAADIVLLKKSLTVIVDGIREGREIFANTVKYIKTTLISNFGNFYAIAIASLLIPYLPMLPVQILLLNLLSDFPMIAIATDTTDKSELRRPKTYNVREVVLLSMVLGAVSTIFDFIFFTVFRGHAASLQTNWFVGSVLTELVLIFSIRTRRFFLAGRRPAALLSSLCLFAFVSAIVLPYSGFGQRFFNFVPPALGELRTILVIVATYFVFTEAIKILYYHYTSREDGLVV